MSLGLKLPRLLRILALMLAVPLGVVLVLEIVTVLLAKTGADIWPIVWVMDALIYLVMGLGFLVIPLILVVMLLLTVRRLRRPGSPAQRRAA